MALQLAKAAGLRTIITSSRDEKLERARSSERLRELAAKTEQYLFQSKSRSRFDILSLVLLKKRFQCCLKASK